MRSWHWTGREHLPLCMFSRSCIEGECLECISSYLPCWQPTRTDYSAQHMCTCRREREEFGSSRRRVQCIFLFLWSLCFTTTHKWWRWRHQARSQRLDSRQGKRFLRSLDRKDHRRVLPASHLSTISNWTRKGTLLWGLLRYVLNAVPQVCWECSTKEWTRTDLNITLSIYRSVIKYKIYMDVSLNNINCQNSRDDQEFRCHND